MKSVRCVKGQRTLYEILNRRDNTDKITCRQWITTDNPAVKLNILLRHSFSSMTANVFL
jgi:hypothetical protein